VEWSAPVQLKPLNQLVATYDQSVHRTQSLSQERTDRLRLSKSELPPHWWTKLSLLCARQWKVLLREPRQVIGPIIQCLIYSVFLGLLFLRIKHDQTGVQNTLGSLFVLTFWYPFFLAGNIVTLFPEERPFFLREYVKGMYSVPLYFLAKNTMELPFQIIGHVPIIITYYMIGYEPEASHLGILIGVMFLVSQTAIGAVMALGAMFAVKEAVVLAPTIMTVLAFFAGLFLNGESIPKYFIWIEKISPFRYGYEALLRNELEDRMFYCTASQLTANDTCPYVTGISVFYHYGFSLQIWTDVVVLAGMVLVLRVVALLVLLLAARRFKHGV